jgi:hypothetical protein
LLHKILKPHYAYIDIGLEGFSEYSLSEEEVFIDTLRNKIATEFKLGDTGLSTEAKEAFALTIKENGSMSYLANFMDALRNMCMASSKRVILAIDEVDIAGDQL